MLRGTLLSVVIFYAITSTAQEFVTVRAGQFYLNDKPYHFVGANMWYGCYLGSVKMEGGRDRLIRELDNLKRNRITNLRILGASESSAFGNHLPYSILESPSTYDEEMLEGLDFLLAEMGKRKMKAVIYLTNYWNWSGGMGQYLVWSDPVQAAAVAANPERPWEREMALSSLFYSNEQAQAYFRNYISMLLNRVNTFSNVAYKEDPSIMAWQLSNEPRPGMDGPHGEQNMDTFLKWLEESASFIKTIDKKHLVSTGSEGKMGVLQNLSYYEKCHAVSSIDYLTAHVWAKNWNWFDANNPEATYSNSEVKALEYFQLHIDLASKMKKPLVLEEFGLDRDDKSLTPGTSVKLRNTYFQALFNRMYTEAKNQKAIAGANFWAWGGEGIPMPEIYDVISASNYVGDPFFEPQGLNSVFIKDKSTVKVIRKFNRKFSKLK